MMSQRQKRIIVIVLLSAAAAGIALGILNAAFGWSRSH